MTRWLSVLVLAMALTGCAAYSLVEPRRTAIGDLYTVEPQIPWSAKQSGKYEVWTVDGGSLEQVQFINGIADGETLFTGKEQYKKLVFKKNMSASEIMELVVDGLAADDGQKLETKNLKPVQFGSHPGFRFELSFVTKESLESEGLVVGAVIKDKLYLIKYTGTRIHYFRKYKEHVERIIESIKML